MKSDEEKALDAMAGLEYAVWVETESMALRWRVKTRENGKTVDLGGWISRDSAALVARTVAASTGKEYVERVS